MRYINDNNIMYNNYNNMMYYIYNNSKKCSCGYIFHSNDIYKFFNGKKLLLKKNKLKANENSLKRNK